MKPHTLFTPAAAALMLSLCAATGKEEEAATKLDFAILKKTKIVNPWKIQGGEKMVFPEDLKKLEGKRVMLEGFVYPYDDPDKMTKMMVFREAAGCSFCAPPGQNETVFVRLAPGEKPLTYELSKVRVEGIMHLSDPGSKDEEAKQFCFTIDKAVAKGID